MHLCLFNSMKSSHLRTTSVSLRFLLITRRGLRDSLAAFLAAWSQADQTLSRSTFLHSTAQGNFCLAAPDRIMSQPDELDGVDRTSIGEINIWSQIWLRTSFCNERPFALADLGFMVLDIDRDVPF